MRESDTTISHSRVHCIGMYIYIYRCIARLLRLLRALRLLLLARTAVREGKIKITKYINAVVFSHVQRQCGYAELYAFAKGCCEFVVAVLVAMRARNFDSARTYPFSQRQIPIISVRYLMNKYFNEKNEKNNWVCRLCYPVVKE